MRVIFKRTSAKYVRCYAGYRPNKRRTFHNTLSCLPWATYLINTIQFITSGDLSWPTGHWSLTLTCNAWFSSSFHQAYSMPCITQIVSHFPYSISEAFPSVVPCEPIPPLLHAPANDTASKKVSKDLHENPPRNGLWCTLSTYLRNSLGRMQFSSSSIHARQLWLIGHHYFKIPHCLCTSQFRTIVLFLR